MGQQHITSAWTLQCTNVIFQMLSNLTKYDEVNKANHNILLLYRKWLLAKLNFLWFMLKISQNLVWCNCILAQKNKIRGLCVFVFFKMSKVTIITIIGGGNHAMLVFESNLLQKQALYLSACLPFQEGMEHNKKIIIVIIVNVKN